MTASVPLFAQVDPIGAADSLAQPIVPGPDFVDTADPILPGAEEVVGDVQSAMFWSRYQRGAILGWSYVVFPDGSARILEDGGQRTAAYALSCSAGVSCLVKRSDGSTYTVPATGAARPATSTVVDGETLARYLAEWILAGTGTPPQDPGPVAQTAPSSRPATDTPSPVGQQTGPDADPAADGAGAEEEEEAQSADAETVQPAQTENAPADRQSADIGPDDTSCPELPGFVPNICDPVASVPNPARPRSSSADRRPAPQPAKTDDAPVAEDEKETFLQRANLQCYITGSFSLRYTDPDTDTTGPGKPRVNFGCSGKVTPRLSFQFFLRRYLKPEQQQPWDPDFTYALTYKVSELFSFTYSNYLARFDGPNGEGSLWDSLSSGNLRGNFRLPRYELPNGEAVACVVGAGFPNFPEERLTLSCGAGITKKLRIGGTAYLYFPGQQDTYEPDFSYTASYKISEKYRLSYSNYSNNRWNFNEGDAPGPGFVGGSLSLTYTIKF